MSRASSPFRSSSEPRVSYPSTRAHASVALLCRCWGASMAGARRKISVSGYCRDRKQKERQFQFHPHPSSLRATLAGMPSSRGARKPGDRRPHEPKRQAGRARGAKGPVAFDIAGGEIGQVLRYVPRSLLGPSLRHPERAQALEPFRLSISCLLLQISLWHSAGHPFSHLKPPRLDPQARLQLPTTNRPAGAVLLDPKLDAKLAGAAAGITVIDLKLAAPRVRSRRTRRQAKRSLETELRLSTASIRSKRSVSSPSYEVRLHASSSRSSNLDLDGRLPGLRY